MLITENQLDEWVRSNKGEAQGVIVELIGRLVAASCPRPRERRFQWEDSIGQHGPDGVLDTDLDFEPFVPKESHFGKLAPALGPAIKPLLTTKTSLKMCPKTFVAKAPSSL